MMRKDPYGLLFVLGISFLLSLSFSPPFDLLRDDREVFSYAGMAILKGAVPYRDFFDHKPPGIYFINAAGQVLGGPWGLWAINMILAGLVTALLFRRCQQYRLPFAWLLPLLFNLMLRDNLISKGIGMTREYTAMLTIMMFCIFLGRHRYRYFGLGALCAIIFFMQQDQVLVVLPFLLYTLLAERSLPGIARMSAGFLFILLPVILYFAWHHALVYFWEDAFRFNTTWYTAQPKSLGDHLRTIKRSLDDGNYEFPLMISVVLSATSLFMRHKRKGLLVTALAALFLSFAPEFMGNHLTDRAIPRDFVYYFLPLSGTVCALLFVTLAYADEALLGNRNVQLPYALLLCCSLGYTALQHSSHLIRRDSDPVVNSRELNYLRQHRPADYDLYVFNDDAYLYAYNEFHILAPSRWIYHHMWSWYPRWDPDHALLNSIAGDLLRHRTTYILSDPSRLDLFLNRANAAWWSSFMQTYYEPLPLPGSGNSILWKRKTTL